MQSLPRLRGNTSLPESKAAGQEKIPLTTRLQKRQIDSEDDSDDDKGLSSSSISCRSTADSPSVGGISTTPPEQYARVRATAFPPEARFRHYSRTVSKAGNAATMVYVVSGHMLKKYDDDSYRKAFNRAFTAFPKDLDFAKGLKMQEYHPFPIDARVSRAVLYKDNPYSLTLPHLAGEWKGSNRSIAEAILQSCYDRAALSIPETRPFRTFTTDGTTINFYAHYYQYASMNIQDALGGHNHGYKGIRNEQDHAKDESYALRDLLKVHWKQSRGGLQPLSGGASLPDLNEAPSMPFPAQRGSSDHKDEGEGNEPLPLAPSTRRRTSKQASPARGISINSRHKFVDTPSYAPTLSQSSEGLRRSARLSKLCQLSEDL
ncbi:hypothetical protein F5Y10DRAFT_277794 [Nemania abortiva]|nr:hypothetical protein F5Y10DRAFT_277794 [Nemania abortiva]